MAQPQGGSNLDGAAYVNKAGEWKQQLITATDQDRWGQRIEAAVVYKSLARELQQYMDDPKLTTAERSAIGKLHVCVRARINAIRTSSAQAAAAPNGSAKHISPAELAQAASVLDHLFKTSTLTFPAELLSYASAAPELQPARQSSEEIDLSNRTEEEGTLLPPPRHLTTGDTLVSFHISRVDIKNARTMLDPRIRFCVYDKQGEALERSQITPISTEQSELCIHLRHTLHMQNSLQRYGQSCVCVLELLHYKPKKCKLSCRAWAVLEGDELSPGDKLLELYKKPADPTLKKVSLLTAKSMYLHLTINMRTM